MTNTLSTSTVPWAALRDRFAGYRALFDTTIPGDSHREIALIVEAKRCTQKLEPKEFEWLCEELADVLKEFMGTLRVPLEKPASLTQLTTNGVLWLDHKLATFTQSFGPDGEGYAEFVLEVSHQHLSQILGPEDLAACIVDEGWTHWETKKHAEPPWPICFLNIAQTYFLDVLKDELEAKRREERAEQRREQKNPPGLQDEICRTISRAFFEPHNTVKRGTVRPYVVINSSNHVVAYSAQDLSGYFPLEWTQGELDSAVLRNLQQHMQQSLKLLRNVTAHRLIRWIAQQCATRRRGGKSFGESRLLRWDGGVESLAHLIGESNPSSGRVQHKLKRILEAGRWLKIEWPNGSRIGGLWMERLFASRGWSEAWGELDVAPFFVPGFAHRYGLKQRQIVPIVPLPPGIKKAHSAHQGALAACQLELVTLITERKAQLIQHGGAQITRKERARIAGLYGLKPETFEGYFEQWLQDTDHGVRMFEESQPDRYSLANNELFGSAHTFLLEGGRRSRAGQLGRQKGSKDKK